MNDNKIKPEGRTIIKVPGDGMDAGWFQFENGRFKGDKFSITKIGNSEPRLLQNIIQDIQIKVEQVKNFYLSKSGNKNYEMECEYLEHFLDLANKPVTFFISPENKIAISTKTNNPKEFLDNFILQLDDKERTAAKLLKGMRGKSTHEKIVRLDIVKEFMGGKEEGRLEIGGIELNNFYQTVIQILDKFIGKIKITYES